jgi:hypothetical protein
LGTGQTVFDSWQRIENVRTFAGQAITFSVWAKSSGSRNLTLEVAQNFGSGGSTQVTTTILSSTATTTGWVRYSGSITMPSVSGKTIGTNSYLNMAIRFSGVVAGDTFDIWGVQLEAGSIATPFQTATGTLQGELAACQRYFRVATFGILGACVSSTTAQLAIYHPSMRTSPTVAAPAAVLISDMISSDFTQSAASVSIIGASTEGSWLSLPNFTGMTTGRPAILRSTTGITFSAEL